MNGKSERKKQLETLLLNKPSFPLAMLSTHLHPLDNRDAGWNELVP